MSNVISIKVEDVNTKMVTYTGIELYSATSISGAYSLLTTLTLVADDIIYTYTDSAGDLSTWYKYRFHNATGPVNSSYSNSFQPEGSTRKTIRQKALATYKTGLTVLASAGGDTTHVFTDDYRVRTSFFASGKGKGSWLHPTTGAQAGETRRVVDTAPTSGSFTVAPAITGAVAVGDEFEWHWLADPDTWNEAINNGLARYFYLDRLALVGDGNAEQSLSYLPWLKHRNQVMGLWWYPRDDGTDVEQAWGSSGRWWNMRQESGYLTLMTNPPLETTNTIYLEAIREMPSVFLDSDALPTQCDIDLAAAFAYDEVLSMLLNPAASGLAASDLQRLSAAKKAHQKGKLKALITLNRPHPRIQPPMPASPVRILGPWSAR